MCHYHMPFSFVPKHALGKEQKMEYTTQMDAARKGIFTPEMAKVAEKEHLEPKKLIDRKSVV